jgi:hypothetical protein
MINQKVDSFVFDIDGIIAEEGITHLKPQVIFAFDLGELFDLGSKGM